MSWQKKTLGDLVDNFSVRAKDYGGSDNLEFFGVSNEVGITKTKYAAEDKAEDYKIIEKGCFAFNPYRVNVGSIGLYNENIKGLISPAYVVFKPKKKSIKPELLLKFLKSSEGLRQIKFYVRGTVRQALRFEDLCQIELFIPDYDEQEILFEKLNSVQIESQVLKTELILQQDLVKQLRQSFLREAMQGKLVNQNAKDGNAKELLQKIKNEKLKLNKKEKPLPEIKAEEIPFAIPENWEWCRLGELLNIKSGKRIHASDYCKEGIPFLRSGEIGSLGRGENIKDPLFISEEKYKDIKVRFGIPKSSDILIACIGGSIGNTWVVDDREFYFKDGNLVLIESQPLLNTSFVLSYLKSPFFWNNTIMNATDSSYNALTIEKLNDAEFPLPPLPEQSRIVKKLEELMNLCDELQASIQTSKQQNEQLLQSALRDALREKESVTV